MSYKKLIFFPLLIFVGILFVGCSWNKLKTDGATEYHHIFPREFRNDFLKAGINVDDFTIALTKKDHRGMGVGLQYVPKNWNKEWRQWIIDNPDFTEEAAEEKAKSMLIEAGCKGAFQFYNYQTKKLSGAKLAGITSLFVCSKNWFLNFCGKIGYWLLAHTGGSIFIGQILSVIAALGSIILGWFGVKAEHPVTLGVGIIAIIIGIFLCIGLIIFVKWIIGVIILAIGGGSKLLD